MAAKKRHNKRFIQGAIKRPGALTRKAKGAGESIKEFARAHQHDSGVTGDEARFYENVLSRVGHGRKHDARHRTRKHAGRRRTRDVSRTAHR